jgi:hypothetical protein
MPSSILPEIRRIRRLSKRGPLYVLLILPVVASVFYLSLFVIFFSKIFLYRWINNVVASGLVVVLYLAVIAGFHALRRQRRSARRHGQSSQTSERTVFERWLDQIAATPEPRPQIVSALLWLAKWAVKYLILLISMFAIMYSMGAAFAMADLLAAATGMEFAYAFGLVLVGAGVLYFRNLLARHPAALARLAQRRTNKRFDAWRARLAQT